MVHKPEKHMVLTAFMLPAGYYKGSWRMPGSRSEELGYLGLIADMARACERAKLDAVFFGDIISAQTVLQGDIMMTGTYEPVSSMSVLAGLTEKIGLIGTISTSFSLPFVTARQLSGLDSLSGGRAGWNIVTSASGEENFGQDEPRPPQERYRRAAEFVDVVTKLWDSWSDDAVINDRESGWWADPAKIRAIDHEGEFFKVKGPLNMRRSPQGRPVMVQAGSSGPGVELGSSVADAIYTVQPDKQRAIQFRAEYDDRLKAKGRHPKSVKILPGILPIVADTDAEAQELTQELANHINYDIGRLQFKRTNGIDVSDLDLDDRIPPERYPENPAAGSRYALYRRWALEDGYTVRDLIITAARSSGHSWIAGSPSTIADHMIDWFDSRACDGFSLNPPFIPGGLDNITNLLVPELQERGYFRSEYEGTTLRDHLGLDHPPAWDAKGNS